jgi:hypothetical protein
MKLQTALRPCLAAEPQAIAIYEAECAWLRSTGWSAEHEHAESFRTVADEWKKP